MERRVPRGAGEGNVFSESPLSEGKESRGIIRVDSGGWVHEVLFVEAGSPQAPRTDGVLACKCARVCVYVCSRVCVNVCSGERAGGGRRCVRVCE